MFSSLERRLKISLSLGLVVCCGFWFVLRFEQAHWMNIPPAPAPEYAALYGLGDRGFSYRMNSLMVQNFGDSGGRFTPLQDYDYDALARWLYVLDSLDPYSDYIPYLTTFYFGGVQKPEKLRPILPYLKDVGVRGYGTKWRWLAHASWLARYRLEDSDLALEYANLLAGLEGDDLPGWARQMPSFILLDQGEKTAAYSVMIELLKSKGESLHPNEVYSMKIYICTRLLGEEEASLNPLCEGI